VPRYSADPKAAAAARRAAVRFASAYGFSTDALFEIECAVGAALTNAVRSGGGSIDVTYRFVHPTLIIEITDHGGSLPRAEQPGPHGPDDHISGFFIMRALMDRVTFFDNGTRARLEKRLKNR
jgi:anti-sigma regulatory factor (Ser/Thr protein kinase)